MAMHIFFILWPTDTKTWHLHYPTPNKTFFFHWPVSTETTRPVYPKGQTTSSSPQITSEISNTLLPAMSTQTSQYRPHLVPHPWCPPFAEHCPTFRLEDARHQLVWPPFQNATLRDLPLPMRAILRMQWTSGRSNEAGRLSGTRPCLTPSPGRMERSGMSATSVERSLGNSPTSR